MFGIAPSLLCANQIDMKSQIEQLETFDIDWYHIDIMDGNFVPNFAFGTDFVRQLRKVVSKPIYIHLMADNPLNHVETFSNAGADYLCFHIETTHNPFRLASEIKKHSMKASVALNPYTPVTILENLLPHIDAVTLMAIEPGFSGQKFMDFTYEKIRQLKKLINRTQANVIIEVDGGADPLIAQKCIVSGADVVVGGYFSIFDRDYSLKENYVRYMKTINKT
ncbi:MAG: ribulose-phosphate 3-epimerase [Thermoanaerobacteraceae bacterium]|nr:ribulose-phosphate 3-epimerase [Thermoanaerobacteraceae bacterium]